MPVHDWTRVGAGDFHDIHGSWMTELRKSLNGGALPTGFSAQSGRRFGGFEADVLTPGRGDEEPSGRGHAVLPRPARIVETVSRQVYPARQRRLAVRGADRQLVAVIEIVSPANKRSRAQFAAFVGKAFDTLSHGVHLVVLDVLPPTRCDPGGLHRAIWEAVGGRRYAPPEGEPLTLASYDAGPPPTAHVEPVAVGGALPELPLFLAPGLHAMLPLEATYMEAYRYCPGHVRAALEA